MTVLNQHANFKPPKQLYAAQNPTSTSPLVSGEQHIVILYVVILLYDELKGSLPGHSLFIPGHYLENSLIFMIFSIRSFDCMVCRSFHTLSRYDFRSDVIRPNAHIDV